MEAKTPLAESLMTLPPSAMLDPSVLDLCEVDSIECRVSLSQSALTTEHYLVIDVYSYANPVHPEGHVGWWKVGLDDRREFPVVVAKTRGGVSVQFPDAKGDTESWLNPDTVSGLHDDVMIVHVVLRTRANDAISFDDLVPLYMKGDRHQGDLRRQRDLLDDLQGLTGAAYPGYLWPVGPRVHLVTETFTRNDAVGNFVLDVYKLLNRSLVPCSIYAKSFDPTLKPAVAHVSRLAGNVRPQDVVFFNFSIYDEYLAAIAELPCKRLCYFHNITPPHFVRIYDAELAADCEKAFDQSTALLRFDKLIANSRDSKRDLERLFGEGLFPDAADGPKLEMRSEKPLPERTLEVSSTGLQDLKESILRRVGLDKADLKYLSDELADSLREHVGKKLGLDKWLRRILCEARGGRTDMPISVCPPAINPIRWDGVVEEEVDLPDFGTTILYVGRIAPHKKVEDLITLLHEYGKLDEDSCLLVIGSSDIAGYYSYLRYLLLTKYKILENRVFFLSALTPGALKTVYKSCSVYVSMSEHEGFCLPILEAMGMGKPVFAYALPAVQETLGNCGRLFWSKNIAQLAAEIYRLLHDARELAYVVEAQRSQFDRIAAQADGSGIWAALREVLFGDASTV